MDMERRRSLQSTCPAFPLDNAIKLGHKAFSNPCTEVEMFT
jgi:hypothetical protein